MSKFNQKTARARGGAGVIESTNETVNHKGEKSYKRSAKSELFLLGISDFVADTFYESADNRQDRINTLVSQIVVEDLEWLKSYVEWLRNTANMRSVSLSIALRAAHAMNKKGITGARSLVSSVLIRADEPGEALAFWHTEYGRKLPSAVKRGISDAAVRTYTQYSYAKYDSARNGYRFGDVLQLTHPKPKDLTQEALFKYTLDKMYNSDATIPDELDMLTKRQQVLRLPKSKLRKLIDSSNGSKVLKDAGFTWEALSGSIEGGMDAKAWETIIPSMGYMALLRNLKNFYDAGVSREVMGDVASRISDKDEVARSRQLPFRFLSAYRELGRYGYNYFLTALEDALEHSLVNVPALDGKTLIVIDNSGSMYYSGGYGSMTYADTANLFGVALAKRANDATVVVYGTRSNELNFRSTSSTFHIVKNIQAMGGTDTAGTIKKHYNESYTRVIVLTDEQYGYSYGRVRGNPYAVVNKSTPVFTWNLAGYESGNKAESNRYTLGGLTDASFRTIPLVEASKDEQWPWEVDNKS